MFSFRFTAFARGVALAVLTSLVVPVLADPPAHAPAHGWRKKHDPHYVGYTGGEWEHDYGIRDGSCNRKAIGTVLGGVVGGVVGSQVGEGDGRKVATILGAVIGAAIGREIGRNLDDRDRGCIGHGLELAQDGQKIRWSNEATGIAYVLTPLAGSRDKSCRNFKLQVTNKGNTRTQDGRACRSGDGAWKIA